MQPISVIIPTYNEADNLRELLPLVQWADEVLVVDSFSDDETVSIAKASGCRVLQRAYENSASQKNWAIPQAQHEWIFLIDADERPTPELIAEIQSLRTQGTADKAGYWIYRRNYFLGQRVRYSGWQHDKVVRLFRRSQCRYASKQVHAEIETAGELGFLQAQLAHYTSPHLDHFLQKMRRYAAWSAGDYQTRTPRVTYYHLVLKPGYRFIRHYILQCGFLDGKVGFMISVIMAWGVFLRYAKLHEQHMSSK